MLRSLLFLIGGLSAGWLIAIWWVAPREAVAPSAMAAVPEAGAPSSLEGRVAALESALASERAERLALEAELEAVGAAMAGLERSRDAFTAEAAAPGSDDGPGLAFDGEGPFAERFRELRERRETGSEERRVARLVDAGFAPDRAEWIARREAELRMSALQAQYDARRTGEPPAAAVDPDAVLRAELGSADYERYLEATGRPASVAVRSVLAGSPAEQAGFEPGDRLVGYGGRRVYDIGDLNRLTLEGAPGEPVIVDVVRDGQTIQLVIPRGPLGITGGGRGLGRRGP